MGLRGTRIVCWPVRVMLGDGGREGGPGTMEPLGSLVDIVRMAGVEVGVRFGRLDIGN